MVNRLNETVQEEILQVERLITEDEHKNALELVRKISKEKGLSIVDEIACTLLESRILFTLDEREKAVNTADDVWPTIRSQEDLLIILDYLIFRLNAFWGMGEYDKGIKMFEEHMGLIAKLQSKVPKDKEESYKLKSSSFLLNVGILYWYKGELDEALVHHTQSLVFAEEINDKTSIARAYNNIGLIYWSKSELDKSIEFYQRSLNIYEELGLKQKTGGVLSNLANVYTMMGDLDKALENQLHALEIKKQSGEKTAIAISLINVGVVFQLKGNLDQAADYYKKGLNLSEEIDSKPYIALALNNIANIFGLRGNLDSATEFYKRSLKIYKELGIKEKIALLLANIGSNCRERGNISEAIEYFNQSLSIYEEIGSNFGSAVVLLDLLQEALEQNNQKLVEEYLEKLQQINNAEKIPAIDQRFRLAKALSLKISDKSRSKAKAIVLLEQIIEEEIIDHSISVKAMVHLCDMLISELKKSADIELLEEIKELVRKLHKIAEEQSSDSILAEIYRLEALLALAELDLKESRLLLEKGLTLAEDKGLESIASNIREEQNRLEEQITVWEELQERKAPLKETLQYVKIEESVKQLQKEETIASRKLFSLKI